jgi:hypothetical protein
MTEPPRVRARSEMTATAVEPALPQTESIVGTVRDADGAQPGISSPAWDRLGLLCQRRASV